MSKHRWDDLMARPVRRAEVTPGAPRWADLTAPVMPAARRKATIVVRAAEPVVDVEPEMIRRVRDLPRHHRQMVRAEIRRRASSGALYRGKAENDTWIGLFLAEIGAV